MNKIKKRKRFKHLNIFERTKIEIRYKEGKSYGEIAKEIHRPKSAVWREIKKFKSKKMGKYTADVAHEKTINQRKTRGVRARLKDNMIMDYVIEKMKLGWSPEQVSIRLSREHKDKSISYEAIYQFVYENIQASGKVKRGCEDLRRYLPRRHARRATKGARRAQKTERMASLPSIDERSKEVEKRKVVGHWEDDSMLSRQSKERIKSINERVSGVVLLGKMRDGSKEESTRVVIERMKNIPSPYLKTLTRDRGSENLDYKYIENSLGLKVFFAHPYCSQERGSNENLNGLIRRFFPKKTDLSKVSDEDLRKVEFLLNTRPRKRFGGKNPLEVLLEKTGVAITY